MIRSILRYKSTLANSPLSSASGNLRRVACQVHKQRHSIQTTVLFKVLLEESRGFHVDTHCTEDDVEVVLVAVVNGL